MAEVNFQELIILGLKWDYHGIHSRAADHDQKCCFAKQVHVCAFFNDSECRRNLNAFYLLLTHQPKEIEY